MATWFWYGFGAAVLYGLHQVFTKLAADRIGEGLGGFVVEATAALSIGVYLGWLWLAGAWDQKITAAGTVYSVLTGICVGVRTIFFFLLFQKGGPLSAVPMVLAGGAALMALIEHPFYEGAGLLAAPAWHRSFYPWFVPSSLFAQRAIAISHAARFPPTPLDCCRGLFALRSPLLKQLSAARSHHGNRANSL